MLPIVLCCINKVLFSKADIPWHSFLITFHQHPSTRAHQPNMLVPLVAVLVGLSYGSKNTHLLHAINETNYKQ